MPDEHGNPVVGDIVDTVFGPTEIISAYSREDAMRDGVMKQIGPQVFINTVTLNTIVAQAEGATKQEKADYAHEQILRIVKKFASGEFYDDGATDYPNECDAGLACYAIGGEKVWATWERDAIILYLPSER